MKRILCLLLVFSVLAFTACTDAGDDVQNGASSSNEESNATVEVSNDDDMIVVPDVTGKTPDEAEEILKNAGFTVKKKEKPYDDVPEGEVAGVDLTVGESYKPGTKIWLYVSTGKGLAASTLEFKQSTLVESREVLETGANSDYEPLNYEFMRACWISQYDTDNFYTDGGLQRNEDDFREKVKVLFSALAERGFNTLIVQLRPNGDSFYPSAYYCPSNYVTGAYAIDFTYDPLAIMVEEAHALNLSFHGWINPLRCMLETDLVGINISYGVRAFSQEHMGDYIVNYSGRLYLNPGREEVRQLIIDGAAEIVRYYDVDGVHIDDYFYPTTDSSFDRQSFKDQSETTSLTMFRRSSLNKLVSGIYSAVKAENPKVLFGVSPAGNLGNVRTACADIDTWLTTPGYLDYIMPQLYYGMKNGKYSFDTLYDSWSTLVTLDSIRVIPGMTLEYASAGYSDKSTDEWNNSTDVLKRSLEYAYKFGNCSGFALFSSSNAVSTSGGEQIVTTKAELDNLFEFALIIPSDRIK